MNRRNFLKAFGVLTVAAATGCRPTDDPKPEPKVKKLQFGRNQDQRPGPQAVRDAVRAGYDSIRVDFMNNFDLITNPSNIQSIRDNIVALRDAARQENIPLTFHGTINLREFVYQQLRSGGG